MYFTEWVFGCQKTVVFVKFHRKHGVLSRFFLYHDKMFSSGEISDF